MNTRSPPRFTPRPATGPRARGLADSWVLATALAVATHLAVAWLALPVPEPTPDRPYPSFTLLPSGPPGAPGAGSGGAGYGDGGGDGDEGGPIVVDGALLETFAPPELLQPMQPADLPRGGDLPVRLTDRSKERTSLIEQLEREERRRAALEQVGVRSGSSTGGGGGDGGGGGGDPELWAWKLAVEGLFREAFHPLVSTDRALVCSYLVDFDAVTGAVGGFTRHAASGEPAYDAAAERAIRTVTTVPLPPERFAAQIGTRLLIDFHPP